MSQLVECRYNKNHKMKAVRIFIHENTCPDKNKSDLVCCQYDYNHKIKKLNFEQHLKVCPSRPKIEEDVQQQMLEYVLKHGSKNSSNAQKAQNITNIQSKTSKVPAGMKKVVSEKIKMEENKQNQKEIRKLIKNMENYDDIGDEHFNNHEIGSIIDEEFEKEMINFEHSSKRENIPSPEQSIITNLKYKDGITEIEERKKKLIFDDTIYENENYDPNQSDIYIDRKNKNNVSDYIYYNQ